MYSKAEPTRFHSLQMIIRECECLMKKQQILMVMNTK